MAQTPVHRRAILPPVKERVQRGATRPLILREVAATRMPITAREFYDEVHRSRRRPHRARPRPGDRVAIMSCTRYEWIALDSRLLGGRPGKVPIYETSSIDQVVAYAVLVDADVTLIVTETVSMAEIVRARQPREHRDTHVLSWIPRPSRPSSPTVQPPRVIASSPARRSSPKDDIVTIVYTMGTIGHPQGHSALPRELHEPSVNAHGGC